MRPPLPPLSKAAAISCGLLLLAPPAADAVRVRPLQAATATPNGCTSYTVPKRAELSGAGKLWEYYHFLIDFAPPVYHYIRNDTAHCKVLYLPDWWSDDKFRLTSREFPWRSMEVQFQTLFSQLGLTLANINRKELVAGARDRTLININVHNRGQWSSLPADYYKALRSYARALPGVRPVPMDVTCIKRGWPVDAKGPPTAAQRRHLSEEFYDNLTRDMGAGGLRHQVLELETMPLLEQISAFAGSRAVVGQHGAGLSNIIFVDEGALVVEIGRRCIQPCYPNLAARLGHSYLHFEDHTSYPVGLADTIRGAIGLFVHSGADAVRSAGFHITLPGKGRTVQAWPAGRAAEQWGARRAALSC
mmetsp:Transcript_47530/g.146401  ORF Transcript_47530/g.146401 Transcript_47530/m.146401 type:complete len:361 (-) Transcript_47530:27-1109(-)